MSVRLSVGGLLLIDSPRHRSGPRPQRVLPVCVIVLLF